MTKNNVLALRTTPPGKSLSFSRLAVFGIAFVLSAAMSLSFGLVLTGCPTESEQKPDLQEAATAALTKVNSATTVAGLKSAISGIPGVSIPENFTYAAASLDFATVQARLTEFLQAIIAGDSTENKQDALSDLNSYLAEISFDSSLIGTWANTDDSGRTYVFVSYSQLMSFNSYNYGEDHDIMEVIMSTFNGKCTVSQNGKVLVTFDYTVSDNTLTISNSSVPDFDINGIYKKAPSLTISNYTGSYAIFSVTNNDLQSLDDCLSLGPNQWSSSGKGHISNGVSVWEKMPSAGTYTLLVISSDDLATINKISNVSVATNGSGTADWSSRTLYTNENPGNVFVQGYEKSSGINPVYAVPNDPSDFSAAYSYIETESEGFGLIYGHTLKWLQTPPNNTYTLLFTRYSEGKISKISGVAISGGTGAADWSKKVNLDGSN